MIFQCHRNATQAVALTVVGLAVLLFAGCASLPANDWSGQATASDELLRQIMERDKLPSLSVAVSVDGELAYQRAFGYADIASETLATPATVYAQGSVTKALTATLALQLADDGMLDLNVAVQKYCAAFPEKSDVVTLHQLLAHTAGVRHYDYRRFEEDFMNSTAYESIPVAMRKFANDPLVAAPGQKYHYSSWGYVIVACALENASGQSYAQLLRERILEPANMTHSRMDESALQPENQATGYSLQDNGSWKTTIRQDPSDRYGAAGLLSTPTDMVRFADALLQEKFLDAAHLQTLWSSQQVVSGEPSGHGLGWDLDEKSGAIMKGGTSFDATSYLYVLPAEGVIIAISTNLVLWGKGREELAERLAEIYASPTVDAEEAKGDRPKGTEVIKSRFGIVADVLRLDAAQS